MKKYIVIGIVILFFGASVVSSISIDNSNQYDKDKEINDRCNLLEETILFHDDFDDNTKDYDKWTENWTDGIWDEVNQRVEFQCNEHIPTYIEGIESKLLFADISTDTPLEVTGEMISHLSHYGGYVGKLILKIVDDSGNYILLMYRRSQDSLEVTDSQGSKKILFYLGETSTPWELNITIFSNRYRAIVHGYDSGWIENSIFSGGTILRVQLIMNINGDYPSFWWRAGFDNIVVRGEVFEPKTSILIGKLDNLNTVGDFITFNAVNIRCIQFGPFSFIRYSSGEKLKLSTDYFGILNPKFVLAICGMY